MAERPRQKGGGAEHSNFQKTMKVYDGGQERSRTSMGFTPPGPQPGASAIPPPARSTEIILFYQLFRKAKVLFGVNANNLSPIFDRQN